MIKMLGFSEDSGKFSIGWLISIPRGLTVNFALLFLVRWSEGLDSVQPLKMTFQNNLSSMKRAGVFGCRARELVGGRETPCSERN